MSEEEFIVIRENRIASIRSTLSAKAEEYATRYDVLHNFRSATDFTHLSMQTTLWGFMTKHLVSIRDMIQSKQTNHYTTEQWEEKIGDTINYLILLEAIVKEQK
jgi:hypothetical protein